jgi:hypothetical protein
MRSFGSIKNLSVSPSTPGLTTRTAVPENAPVPDASKGHKKTASSGSYEGKRDSKSFFATSLRSMANRMRSRSVGASSAASEFPASPVHDLQADQSRHHPLAAEVPDPVSPRSFDHVDKNLPTIRIELFGETGWEKGAPLLPQMEKYIKEACINFGKSYEDIRDASYGEAELEQRRELKSVALQFASVWDVGLGETEESAREYLKLETKYAELQNSLSTRIPVPRAAIEENESRIRDMIAEVAGRGSRVAPAVLYAAAGRIEKGVSSVEQERAGYQRGAPITHQQDVETLEGAARFRKKMQKLDASREGS